jgi:hypothetical protein
MVKLLCLCHGLLGTDRRSVPTDRPSVTDRQADRQTEREREREREEREREGENFVGSVR